MKNTSDYVIVTTTIDTDEHAQELVTAIINERLAACVQKLPIESMYRWKGKVESEREHLLHAKTRADLADELCTFIKSRHPYEVPEIIVTPITGGLPEYLQWIADETR